PARPRTGAGLRHDGEHHRLRARPAAARLAPGTVRGLRTRHRDPRGLAGRGGGDGRLREASRGATGPRGGITSGMKGASGVRNEGDVMSSEPQYETIIDRKSVV